MRSPLKSWLVKIGKADDDIYWCGDRQDSEHVVQCEWIHGFETVEDIDVWKDHERCRRISVFLWKYTGGPQV